MIDFSDNNVTGKYRGAAHGSCNVSFKITKKGPVVFHNLEGYDSYLIFKELSKFNVKIRVMPNGLEKCMSFTRNRNIVFIDSMQSMNSSLDSLVKNLGDKDFKYLSEESIGELLELVKEKGIYLMNIWTILKGFLKIQGLVSARFSSSLKDKYISEEEYDRTINV